MNVASIKYGLGNLASVYKALDTLEGGPHIDDIPEPLAGADRIILPGVGAFADGMKYLTAQGWQEAITRSVMEEKKPLLGICLGMQMLATTGYEGGITAGLGLIPGEVKHLSELGCTLRVPHVGWNDVDYQSGSVLFAGIQPKTDFYFVHSFAFVAHNPADVIARTHYGMDVTAAIGCGHVMGCQFHPEKSSKAGLQLIRNFLRLLPC